MTHRPPDDRSHRDPKPEPRPETVDAALALAVRHGRNALAETLLAGHALLDAAAIAMTGRPARHTGAGAPPSEAMRAITRLVDGIDALAARLRADDAEATRRLIDALLGALDSEIARWETQARSDPDARAVLRAFLGLRELLWELGLRPRPAHEAADHGEEKTAPSPAQRATRRRPKPPSSEPPKAAASGAPPPRRRRRVQRVDVES